VACELREECKARGQAAFLLLYRGVGRRSRISASDVLRTVRQVSWRIRPLASELKQRRFQRVRRSSGGRSCLGLVNRLGEKFICKIHSEANLFALKTNPSEWCIIRDGTLVLPKALLEKELRPEFGEGRSRRLSRDARECRWFALCGAPRRSKPSARSRPIAPRSQGFDRRAVPDSFDASP
jgi:hypothetical protein